jgi:hypothetical protein
MSLKFISTRTNKKENRFVIRILLLQLQKEVELEEQGPHILTLEDELRESLNSPLPLNSAINLGFYMRREVIYLTSSTTEGFCSIWFRMLG